MLCFVGCVIMMCLLFIEDLQGFDVVFVGILLDIGILQCLGMCYGLCYICVELVMICLYNMVIGVVLFDLLLVVDIGDVLINIYSLFKLV